MDWVTDLKTFSMQDLKLLARYYHLSIEQPLEQFFMELEGKIKNNFEIPRGTIISGSRKLKGTLLSQDKNKLTKFLNKDEFEKFKEALNFITESEALDKNFIEKLIDSEELKFFQTYIEKFNIDLNTILNNNHDTIVLYALKEGSPDIINYLLKKPFDITVKDTDGNDVFGYALRYHEFLHILPLVKDPNVKQANGETYLMILLKNFNHFKIPEFTNAINLLLEKGAKINEINNNASTALMFACKKKDVPSSIVELLIKKGAKVNMQTPVKKTALMYTLDPEELNENQVGKIKILLENGADINLSDDQESSAIHYLCSPITIFNKYTIQILEMLLEKNPRPQAMVNDVNNELQTPLMQCAENKDANKYLISFIKILLENGADPNKKDIEGKNVLMFLDEKNIKYALQIIQLLIDYGLDVNLKDNEGYTAIFYQENINTIKFLVKNGANVNIINNDGDGVLFSHFDDIDIRNYLISLNAPSNGLNKDQLKTFYGTKMNRLDSELDRYLPLLTPQEKEIINKECLKPFEKYDKNHYDRLKRCVEVAKNMVKLRPGEKKIKELEKKYESHPYFQKNAMDF